MSKRHLAITRLHRTCQTQLRGAESLRVLLHFGVGSMLTHRQNQQADAVLCRLEPPTATSARDAAAPTFTACWQQTAVLLFTLSDPNPQSHDVARQYWTQHTARVALQRFVLFIPDVDGTRRSLRCWIVQRTLAPDPPQNQKQQHHN